MYTFSSTISHQITDAVNYVKNVTSPMEKNEKNKFEEVSHILSTKNYIKLQKGNTGEKNVRKDNPEFDTSYDNELLNRNKSRPKTSGGLIMRDKYQISSYSLSQITEMKKRFGNVSVLSPMPISARTHSTSYLLSDTHAHNSNQNIDSHVRTQVFHNLINDPHPGLKRPQSLWGTELRPSESNSILDDDLQNQYRKREKKRRIDLTDDKNENENDNEMQVFLHSNFTANEEVGENNDRNKNIQYKISEKKDVDPGSRFQNPKVRPPFSNLTRWGSDISRERIVRAMGILGQSVYAPLESTGVKGEKGLKEKNPGVRVGVGDEIEGEDKIENREGNRVEDSSVKRSDLNGHVSGNVYSGRKEDVGILDSTFISKSTPVPSSSPSSLSRCVENLEVDFKQVRNAALH